jgi:hypothetical protein
LYACCIDAKDLENSIFLNFSILNALCFFVFQKYEKRSVFVVPAFQQSFLPVGKIASNKAYERLIKVGPGYKLN